MQNRLKSPVLWSAMAGIIMLVLRELGLEAEIETGSRIAGMVFDFVCAGLAMFGVANNPTSKSNF